MFVVCISHNTFFKLFILIFYIPCIITGFDVVIANMWCEICSVMSDSLQSLEYSPPVSSVCGIFQARILGWVAISFSRRSSQPRDWTWSPTLILGQEDPMQWQADSLPLNHLGSLSLGQSCIKGQWGKNSIFKKLSESLYLYCEKSPSLQMKSVDLHIKIRC